MVMGSVADTVIKSAKCEVRSAVGEVKKSNHRIASSPGKMMMGNGRKCLFWSEVDYCFHLLLINLRDEIIPMITS
jgi:hypothetical protein